MDTYKKNWFKFVVGFIICLFIRLIPFRPPNVEPLLATQMPFSKAYGAFIGFIFAFFSIGLFDFITGSLGIWTLVVATMYGILGLWSAYFFKKREGKKFNYVFFAVIGTLVFDVVTLLMGPIFYHQPLIEALLGQIPFTAWHLLGNVSFAIVLSPPIYRLVIKNKKLETMSILNILKLHQFKKTI